MRLHRRALASSASRVIEQARSRLTRRAASEGGGGGAAPPRAEDVSSAVADVARERNGYLAWSLYVALRQGEVAIAPRDVDSLAGTMLHVDEALHGDMAAKRTLSPLSHAGGSSSHSTGSGALGGFSKMTSLLPMHLHVWFTTWYRGSAPPPATSATHASHPCSPAPAAAAHRLPIACPRRRRE